jgi:hypothetical protein
MMRIEQEPLTMAMIDCLPRTRALLLGFTLGIVLMMGGWDGSNRALAGYQAAPWCALSGGRGSAWDCSYYSFEQCMATARGLSSNCAPNPRYIDRQSRKRRAPR